MKTSLGIWAMGPMVTRFVPGGYQPEHASETTTVKVLRAVEGLGGLIDDYEFHYPQELSPENLDEVRAALDGHGIYCIATGLHLDPRFGKGGLSSPDDAVRAEALRRTLEAIAAAVIGGTSLFGGRGSVWSALLGAVVIGSVGNGLDLDGQQPYVKLIVEGAILLLFVTIDALARRGRVAAGR